ncbi:hypothetical protein ACIQI8_42400 [Streptomyces sp. NPDC092369]|uniref:hypothetical protein n=1 Tax=Streptomyces sp. NPDC092369 TaxID=3366015 RepID=UPI0038087082
MRSRAHGGPEPGLPFLSLHTTVVLLTSFALGLVAGGLTALSGAPGAGSGLAAAGSAVPVLRSLIGPPAGACR